MLKCLNVKMTRGFTLIEAVVAISVLTIGVFAAFNVVQNIATFSRVNASRLTATYLAQEGIELVRNQRDTNWLSFASWNSNIPPSGCTQSDILEKFNRTCSVALAPGPPEKMEISVSVSWQDIGTAHTVTSATELYNWLSP